VVGVGGGCGGRYDWKGEVFSGVICGWGGVIRCGVDCEKYGFVMERWWVGGVGGRGVGGRAEGVRKVGRNFTELRPPDIVVVAVVEQPGSSSAQKPKSFISKSDPRPTNLKKFQGAGIRMAGRVFFDLVRF